MKIKSLTIASILWASTSFSDTALAPKQTIYCQGRDGALFTIGNESLERKVLSNHTPFYILTFRVSPDFRYILHGGTVKAIGLQKLFLYDLQTGKEHFIFETPKYDMVEEEFSPDGKTPALMNVYAPHRQALENEGLFLIDLQTLEKNFFPYPDNTKIPQGDVGGCEMKWSKDGSSIYLAFNGHVKGLFKKKHIREYHRFDIAEKKFYQADGCYEGSFPNGYVFTDQNGSIPVHDNHRPLSRSGSHKIVSPNERWTAEVINRRSLIVSEKNGSTRTVEKTDRCACGACTIGITAWWDNGELLIYRTDELGYCIYNPITEQKGSLFKMSDVEAFTWPEEVQ